MQEVLNNKEGYPSKILDMRPNRRSEEYAKVFNNKEEFKQFMEIIYQVRCNLFHGNKDPFYYEDKDIVESFFEAFLIFCKEIYSEKNYI